MELKSNAGLKMTAVFVCLIITIFGFMIKLPSVFRHHDKELHATFYFGAAAFLNILFTDKKIGRHLFFFIILCLFGMFIEYAQQYSNRFFHSRIHGRYDPEDVKSNIKGLIAFSSIWFCYVVAAFGYNKLFSDESKDG